MRKEDDIQREWSKHRLSDLAYRTNPPAGGLDRRKTLFRKDMDSRADQERTL